MEEATKCLREIDTAEGKVVLVLSEMIKMGTITKEEKEFVKLGILGNDPNCKMLRSLVDSSKDATTISQYITVYLGTRCESAAPAAEDLSPTTTNLINNPNDDSSPTGTLMLHRKMRQQENRKEQPPLNLLDK